jgi:hypothetical protein
LEVDENKMKKMKKGFSKQFCFFQEYSLLPLADSLLHRHSDRLPGIK